MELINHKIKANRLCVKHFGFSKCKKVPSNLFCLGQHIFQLSLISIFFFFFLHWKWLMSARRTQSSTIGNGSDITSIGSVDLKIQQKLPQGLKFEIQYSPPVGAFRPQTLSAWRTNSFTHSLFHLNVCRADVFPGNKSYGAHRNVLKVIAAEFQDTPADPQTLEMDYEILLD